MPLPDPTWLTAVHEAGHVAAALHLGVPVESVRVGDRDGEANYAHLPPDSWTRAVLTAAGPLAEGVVGGAAEWQVQDAWGSAADITSDKYLLTSALCELTADEPEHTRRASEWRWRLAALDEASAIIEANRAGIERLANALLHRHHLTGRECAAVLGVAHVPLPHEVSARDYRRQLAARQARLLARIDAILANDSLTAGQRRQHDALVATWDSGQRVLATV